MTSCIKAFGKTLGFTLIVTLKILMCVTSASFLMRYIEGQGSLFDLIVAIAGVGLLGIYGVKCIDSVVLGDQQHIGISSKLGAFISAMPLTFAMGVVWDNWNLMQVNGVSERSFMIGLFLSLAIVKGVGLVTIMETLISSGLSRGVSRNYMIFMSLLFVSLLTLANVYSSNGVALLIVIGTGFMLILFGINVIGASFKAKATALGTP